MQASGVQKLFAAMLVVGGVAGAMIGAWIGLALVARSPLFVLPSLALVALLCWTTWVGVLLWRGSEAGLRWGRRLYASQIPIISVPGLHFEWYTGLQLGPQLIVDGAETGPSLAFNLGANAQFYLLSAPDAWILGVNLVAVLALLLLDKPQPGPALLTLPQH